MILKHVCCRLENYFVPQDLHKTLPTITIYSKHCPKNCPVPLRTAKLALHSLHSALHNSHSPLHFTLHTPHPPLHTPHCLHKSSHSTIQNSQFNSFQHSAGLLAFVLQAQSSGCVKLVGEKGGLHKRWFVKKLVCVKSFFFLALCICEEFGKCLCNCADCVCFRWSMAQVRPEHVQQFK